MTGREREIEVHLKRKKAVKTKGKNPNKWMHKYKNHRKKIEMQIATRWL